MYSLVRIVTTTINSREEMDPMTAYDVVSADSDSAQI
jgi:hypothetical protein